MKIGIIGGGAAGMMCATTLVEKSLSNEIHIFEKNNKLGVKVALTGGGRCNVTTGISDKNLLQKKYIRGSKFLSPALSAFGPSEVFSWFETRGVPLKVEEGMRVFPESNKSEDIINVFYKILKIPNIRFHFKERVIDIEKRGNQFEVQTLGGNFIFDVLVITTGGNAYAQTGSTGEGYGFAKKLGHSITKLGPSLNSFLVDEKWCKDLTGLSLPNTRFQAQTDTGQKVDVIGPVLFTHFGISGPNTFALAGHLAFDLINPQQTKKVIFIPDADYNFEDWNKALQAKFTEFPNKQIRNILNSFFPSKFVNKVLEIINIKPEKSVNIVTREERMKLAHILSGDLKLTITSRRPGDEFVTAGGISLDELDRKTMQSKLIPNLYFAGEVLDVDGVTGGYNLQAAWATGRLAGQSIARLD